MLAVQLKILIGHTPGSPIDYSLISCQPLRHVSAVGIFAELNP